MSEKTFTASNGFSIEEADNVEFLVRDQHGYLYPDISEPLSDALREYYEHERDEELGRVRWPEDADYVIYRDQDHDDEDGRCIDILHEPSATTTTMWEDWPTESYGTCGMAARWYFTEGPGKPERSWGDTQVGEVWRLTVGGEEGHFLVKESPSGAPYFLGQASSFYTDSGRITAGRKLVNADGSVADDY